MSSPQRRAGAPGAERVIEVLVFDPHAVVRSGLRASLADTPDLRVAGEAGTPAEVIAMAASRAWGVVIVEIETGGVIDTEMIEVMRQQSPSNPVLVFTVRAAGEVAVRALRAGASGFLSKDSPLSQLLDAVRRVANGGRYVTPSVAETLASIAGERTPRHPHERLSDRELEVMRLLASGQRLGDIAETLEISIKTVSTHRTRLLRKMNMSTNAELIRYALTHQLIA